MKTFSLVSALLLAVFFQQARAFTAENFYLGAGPGVGIQYFEPGFQLFAIPGAAHGVLGGRVFAGYRLNGKWSVEWGYTDVGTYHNGGADNDFVCFSSDLEKCIVNFSPLNKVFNENLKVANTINTEAIDVMIKRSFRVSDHIDVFVKAGVAYVDATIASRVNINLNFFPNQPEHFTVPIYQDAYSSNHGNFLHQLQPALAIGDEYTINKLLSLRFEYNFYFPVKMRSDIASDSGTLIPGIILGALVISF